MPCLLSLALPQNPVSNLAFTVAKKHTTTAHRSHCTPCGSLFGLGGGESGDEDGPNGEVVGKSTRVGAVVTNAGRF